MHVFFPPNPAYFFPFAPLENMSISSDSPGFSTKQKMTKAAAKAIAEWPIMK
jgi:hypothetical protein